MLAAGQDVLSRLLAFKRGFAEWSEAGLRGGSEAEAARTASMTPYALAALAELRAASALLG